MSTKKQEAVTALDNVREMREQHARLFSAYDRLRSDFVMMKSQREELLTALKDGEFEVRAFLNQCDKKEIRDSFQGFSKFQVRASEIIAKAKAK